MLIKIVDDDQVFAKKIESMVYDGFKDIFLDYSIDCITSHFEDRYFEKMASKLLKKLERTILMQLLYLFQQ